jgi:xylose isomerase
VWDFAYNSMRSYLILKDKVARFHKDREIQAILRTLAHKNAPLAGLGAPLKFSRALAQKLKDYRFKIEPLRTQGYEYERLDQLTTELLLGVR